MKKSKKFQPSPIFYKLAEDSWDSVEKNSLINHIKSNKRLTYGKYVKNFEKIFSDYLGTKYSVMVNSGGSANLLSILSLFYLKKNRIKRNEEVIVPAVSWSTTFSPLSILGLNVRFVDIDLETLNYDLNDFEKNISKKTKVVIAVNLLGNSNQFIQIKKIIKKKKLNPIIIEDNCESLGAKYMNKKTGSFSLISANSFYFSHHISSIEGGMLSTNSKEVYNLLLSLRSHGWTRDLNKKNPLVKKDIDSFKEDFRFILPGLNLRSTELNAIAATEQLKKIEKFIIARRKNHALFKKLFENDKDFLIQKEIGLSSWFGFSLIIKNKSIIREKLINYLKHNNIETRPIVSGNIINNDMIKFFNINNKKKVFPNAEFLDKNGFFVGNSHKNLKKEIYHLKKTISNFTKKSF